MRPERGRTVGHEHEVEVQTPTRSGGDMLSSKAKNTLTSVDGPYLHYAAGEDGDAIVAALHEELSSMRIVSVDGAELRTLDQMYTTFYSTLFGRDCYGHNWDGFHDVVRDIDVFSKEKEGCILVLKDAEYCLQNSVNDFVMLGNMLAFGGKHSTDVAWIGRPMPFHSIMLFGRLPRNIPAATKIKLR